MTAKFTKKAQRTAIMLIIFLHVVELFAIDSYLPSLPAIAKTLHVANFSVQLSITFFLLGAAAAQFIFGTLSDIYGRRALNILGVSVFILGSFLCLFAPNIHMFLIGRLIQGLGMGSGRVLARAMLRDMFSGQALARVMSILIAIVVLIPLVSPVAGGYIQHYLGWRYSFVLVLSLGIILLITIIAALPETLKIEHKQILHIKNIYQSYKTLFLSNIFLTNVLCACFVSSATIIYITITPFLYQHILHLSPVTFGWVTALIAIGVAAGNIFNSKFVKKIGRTRMIIAGIIIMFFGVILMLIFALMSIVNLYVILLPMLVITTSIGFIGPNVASRAMGPFQKLAGSAAALYGGLQMSIIAGWSAFATIFHTENQKPLAFLLLVLPIAIAVFMYLNKSDKITSHSE